MEIESLRERLRERVRGIDGKTERWEKENERVKC